MIKILPACQSDAAGRLDQNIPEPVIGWLQKEVGQLLQNLKQEAPRCSQLRALEDFRALCSLKTHPY
ncbi:MAG: hypothetical protein Q8K98_00380 [Bacteroidota bacterium]|nr:hypothetical protein [Bacteroidota bacterium]